MTVWVKRLIFANVVMFILTMAAPVLHFLLRLEPYRIPAQPWTVITYMFLHAGIMHLAFNMIGLFFFGPRLEARLGSRHFLGLYFVAGVVAALASWITAPLSPVVGSSGGVYGVLLGFALYWPRERIYIWGILPIEARWLVIIMTAVSLYGGFGGGSVVAHFAHLGGFLGGWLYLKLFERLSAGARFRRKVSPPRVGQVRSVDIDRWRRIDRAQLHPVNRDELERILDKISRQGTGSLTAHEREFLERFS